MGQAWGSPCQGGLTWGAWEDGLKVFRSSLKVDHFIGVMAVCEFRKGSASVSFLPMCFTEGVEWLNALSWLSATGLRKLLLHCCLIIYRCYGHSSFWGLQRPKSREHLCHTHCHLPPHFISHEGSVVVPPRYLMGPLFSLPVTLPTPDPSSSAPSGSLLQWALPVLPAARGVPA